MALYGLSHVRGVCCDGAGRIHGRRKSGGDVRWAISSRHDKKCPVRIARGKVTGRTRLHREHTSFDHERGCKTATVKLQLRRNPNDAAWPGRRTTVPISTRSPSLRAQRSHPSIHEMVHRRVSKAGRAVTLFRICGVSGRGAAKSAGGRQRNRGLHCIASLATTGRA